MSELSVEEAIKEIENYLDYEGSVSIQAIATLYTSYQKEKEKNKKIEDKIIEKIEEYNKMINATYGDMTHHGDIRRDNCIEIRKELQDLLEERN